MGTECPPTIFLYSSHPKKPALQPILWDITGRTGLGLVNRQMQGGVTECRPTIFLYERHTQRPPSLPISQGSG